MAGKEIGRKKNPFMEYDLSQKRSYLKSDSQTQRKRMREEPFQIERTLSKKEKKVQLSSSPLLISLGPPTNLDNIYKWKVQKKSQEKDPKAKGKAKETEDEASILEEAE
ncbi:hypothetical protein O181_072921 [Austropuccinia psidii MF-1]|uniref:Uncharacterized protein n=1 Tax=Austropuccinia psidii MF-1 TaxID=1389203 RepID=A0A9Q3F3L2_9BASI|nr:hypothetical protein [Austropuccinia psidii MF-1]